MPCTQANDVRTKNRAQATTVAMASSSLAAIWLLDARALVMRSTRVQLAVLSHALRMDTCGEGGFLVPGRTLLTVAMQL